MEVLYQLSYVGDETLRVSLRPATGSPAQKSGAREVRPRTLGGGACVAAAEGIVYAPHRLHEPVHRRGSDEPPAAGLQILRERLRLTRRRQPRKARAVESSFSLGWHLTPDWARAL